MRRLALFVVCLFCLLPGLLPETDARTVLHYFSETGDPIGQGQEQLIDVADGARFQVSGGAHGVGFDIQGGAATEYDNALLDFEAPGNANLSVGDYPGATRYPFQKPGEPGLEFDLDGRGSNQLTGQFQILEITFDAAGHLATFAADFVQHSNNIDAACFGQIRYNSDLPFTTPAGVIQLADNHYNVLATAGSVTVGVTRRGGGVGALAVNYSTVDGTDKAGRDYTAVAGTLRWADGDTADKTFTIPVLNSGNPEQGDGTFFVNLVGAAVGTQTQAVVTVVNDNSSITFLHFTSDAGDAIGQGAERTFSILDGYRFQATNSYAGQVGISCNNIAAVGAIYGEAWSLSLFNPHSQTLAVGDYQDNGLPTPPLHPGVYFSGGNHLPRHPAGNFQVFEAVYDDAGVALRFAADFEQHSNGDGPAVRGQVRYNSHVPASASPVLVSVTASTPSVEMNGGAPGVFTVTRTGINSQPLKVAYRLRGSAVGGQDYQALKGTKTIKAGRNSAAIKVHPIQTGSTGGKVTVKLRVEPPADGGFTVIGTGAAKVKILRD